MKILPLLFGQVLTLATLSLPAQMIEEDGTKVLAIEQGDPLFTLQAGEKLFLPARRRLVQSAQRGFCRCRPGGR
ncbi:MAG: hypothetical protein U5L96_19405 [Owenweeksia sp.]|nr:hypothetical protein [Owenweeksia sp.]